jgi:Ras-related protein Rab-28
LLDEQMSEADSFSLAILGDGSTGKSTIIHMFRTEGFERVYKQTIGCDFYEKSMAIRNRDISLKVWDIGGQSIHSKNIVQYVGSSQAIFLVYDVTNPESFSNLDDWLRVARQYSKAKHVYAVGNKIDLISQRLVTQPQHDKFVSENGLQGGLFMSAKSGENVIKAFYQVAGEVVGVRLTAHELAFHDKVIGVSVQQDNEGRTAFADDIEREDMEAEAKKNQGKGLQCCTCS